MTSWCVSQISQPNWISLLTAARQTDSVAALILGDPPLNLEKYLQYEGSAERIKLWRGLQSYAAFRESVPVLAQTLAKRPVGMNDEGEQIQYIELPGVDGAVCREWAKTLSQVDPDAVQYHVEGRLEEYAKLIDFDIAFRQITCPTLVLQGDPQHGGILSDQDIEEILPKFTDSVHVKIEGYGHDLGLSTWNDFQVQRAVSLFLESL